MSDPRSTLERESARFIQTDGAFERLVDRRDRKRRNQRIRAGALGLAIAIAGGWLGVNAIRSTPHVTGRDPLPTPSPVWSPVRGGADLAVYHGTARMDPRDATLGWVDVVHVLFSSESQPQWYIELADKPPLAADLEPGLLIAYGLVLDTTGDEVADYLIGINNDAPSGFRVWVTDLATGETDEQIGPPYGYPIEFSHPDEEDTAFSPPTMIFTFLTAPTDLNPNTVRFYAWASATRDGEVFAWDYAPDAGWMTKP